MNQINNKVPFLDIVLEDKVLRHLVFNDVTDNKEIANTISKHIGYTINLGISKDIFYSDYKKWLYELIIQNYVKHAECISQTMLLEEIKKKYPTPETFEKRKLLLERALKYEFKPQDFKPLLEQLRNKFNYRSLFNLNLETHTSLKECVENDKSESLLLARKINEFTGKILINSDRFRIVEEDIFQNLEADIALIEDQIKNPTKYRGITTGFREIDRATGGWRPGELVVILGRPGMGKSILLLNFGFFAWEDRCNVIYITIEMPAEQQKRRFYSRVTGIDYSKIKMPDLMHETELEMMKKVVRRKKEEHTNNYFYIIDAPQNCDANFIESRIIAFENAFGKKADIVIVDPIYLMKPSIKTDDPVGVVSWDLKLLARKLNIPVLCASQFNRASHVKHQHGKGVDSSDAAFSDKLSNNADMMIGITGDKERAQLSFPKSRDSMITELFFIKNFKAMRFEYDDEESREELPVDEGEAS